MRFEKTNKYKVVISESGKQDIKEKKKYILDNFKYREHGEMFSQKIKKGILELEYFPTGYSKTEFTYKSYVIYMKPCNTYLLLYTIDEVHRRVIILRVMQDGMNWVHILKKWLIANNYLI